MKKFFESIFSLRLYLQGLKKIRAVGIAAAICIIIPNALLPIIRMNTIYTFSYAQDEYDVTYGGFAPYALIMLIFAPIMVHSMFSYLNQRNKSDFYHSLPHKRSCVFISFMLAVISWILAILAVSVTLNMVLWSFVPYYILDLNIVWLVLLFVFVGSLLLASYMTLAMSLTGTTTSNILVFLLIMLLPRIFALMFVSTIEQVVQVVDISYSSLKFLSFEQFLPISLLLSFLYSQVQYLDVGVLIYSLVMALLLIAAAGVIFKIRRSETAGKSAPNKIMQAVYRTAIAAPILCTLSISFLVSGTVGTVAFIRNVAIALVVYMIFELMMTKKLKTMFKSLILFWIPMVVAVAFFGAVKITELSIESIQPLADKIESVMIVDQYKNLNFPRDNYSPGFYEVEITSAEAKELVSKVLEENIENYNKKLDYTDYTADYIQSNYWRYRQMYKIEIKLKNGSTIIRNIKFSNEEREALMYYVAQESEEYKDFLIQIPKREEIMRIEFYGKSVNLYPTAYQFDMLMDTFEFEFNALTDDEKIRYRVMEERYTNTQKLNEVFNIVFMRDGKEYRYTFCVSEEYMPHSTIYIQKHFLAGNNGAIIK